jgi:glycosyltransferase involved in cell wall biosynthesis
MKILFVTGTIDHSHISGSGGVAFVLSRVVAMLTASNIRVSIVNTYHGDVTSPFFKDNVDTSYLQNLFNHEKIKNKFYKIIFWVYLFPYIWKLTKKTDADFIISTSPPITVLLFLPAIFYNKKLISWENIAFSHYRGLFYFLRLYIFKRIHSIITVSSHDFLFFKSNSIKSNLIFNPIDKPTLVKSLSDSSFNFLCAGRLVNQKGFDILINVIKIYELKFKDIVNVTIIGDGPDKLKLQALVSKLRLKSFIKFEPFNPNLSKFYINTNVFLLPSRYEGLPIVLLESQSYGIPAIAFNCPTGPQDVIINNYNGFLIDCFNLDEFANAIYKIKHEDGLLSHLATGAFKKSEEFYGDSVGKAWLKAIYNNFDSF